MCSYGLHALGAVSQPVNQLVHVKLSQPNINIQEWVDTVCKVATASMVEEAHICLRVQAEELAAVKQGKQPYFMKRSETKRQQLIARYKHLKATGGLEKVVQKRRRKNAMKDHRYVPASRQTQQ